MVAHRFGGPWTEIKLEVLSKYLNFYTTALKNQPFKLIYIDAFAGTGERHETIPEAPLLNEEKTDKVLTGSAIKALSIDTPFDIYYFIENNKEYLERLRHLASSYQNRNICFSSNEANREIVNICRSVNWNKYRAVMFLDPYGLDVDWVTLQEIQKTKTIDVWYLFSISGFYRQASRKKESIEEYKLQKLNNILGTDEWLTAIYDNQPTRQGDMFGDNTAITERERDVKIFENYVTSRLETVFPYVSKPLPLPNAGPQLYSLYFCVSNPSEKAINLAKKPSRFIFKMYE